MSIPMNKTLVRVFGYKHAVQFDWIRHPILCYRQWQGVKRMEREFNSLLVSADTFDSYPDAEEFKG